MGEVTTAGMMVTPARLSLALSARKIVLMVFAVLYAATFAIVAISTNFAAGVAKPLLELRYLDVTIGVWPDVNDE